MLKLPRTIRLDPSDTFVFARAAEPGEWAISGAFMFWDVNPEALDAKQRVAFRSGFLGVASLGWSTLATVTDVTEAERSEVVDQLAAQLLSRFGAPNAVAARAAAEDEVSFAASLCDHPAQTLLAVSRSMEEGELRERFRTLKPRPLAPGGDQLHAFSRAFTFHEIEGEEPAEEVDLLGLMKMDRT